MYIKDGIAYAGEPRPPIKVSGIRPMENFRLWVRFSNGEAKVADFKPLLGSGVFAPLKEKGLFESVYIDCGAAVWDGGNIDISPEWLYEHGAEAGGTGTETLGDF